MRAVLLPSTLSLLGERTWYLPRWLSFLPRPSFGDAEEALVPDSEHVDHAALALPDRDAQQAGPETTDEEEPVTISGRSR